jgi:hypothetical protein
MSSSEKAPWQWAVDLADEVAMLREVLVFADGLSVSRGFRLADLYAADSDKQGVLERAGCHPRTDHVCTAHCEGGHYRA